MNQQYPPFEPAPRTSTLAIVSLITGIVSWFILPFVGAIVAVITGHIAKNEIKKWNGRVTGNGMATAGLVLGYIQLGLGLCVCIVFVVFPGIFVTIDQLNLWCKVVPFLVPLLGGTC